MDKPTVTSPVGRSDSAEGNTGAITFPRSVGNMAEGNSDTSEETFESCIFCLIAEGRDKDAKVMMKVSSFQANLEL